jgi:hypothetical protein
MTGCAKLLIFIDYQQWQLIVHTVALGAPEAHLPMRIGRDHRDLVRRLVALRTDQRLLRLVLTGRRRDIVPRRVIDMSLSAGMTTDAADDHPLRICAGGNSMNGTTQLLPRVFMAHHASFRCLDDFIRSRGCQID